MNLEQKIEAILFYKGEPVKIVKLVELCGASKSEVEGGLTNLEQSLSGRGIGLVTNDGEVMLTTAPEMSDLITEITKEELSRDLGKAGLETLAIVTYKGPVSRRDIDYIRGVNSAFILRHLLIRGLVERETNPQDQRSFLYKPTLELLKFLGINKLADLPEWQAVRDELANFTKKTEATANDEA